MKIKDVGKLILCVAACLSAGAIGSIFTRQAIPTWYATLERPAFNPPNWVFAPVWTLLYIMMGVAAFLVWRKGLENRQVKIALIAFLVQLVLNASWSVVFFGLQSPLYGLIVIVVLWVAILFASLSFYRLSRAAGLLMLPYLLWVTFAAVLNESIWLLNR